MELSHFELELSIGESIQIGGKLISVIDTPDHGIALLVESIPDDDDFDVIADTDFDAEDDPSVALSRPR